MEKKSLRNPSYSFHRPFVLLRAMEPEDLDLLYRVENDYDLWQVGSTNVPYSRYFLHDYIANTTGDIFTDKQLRLIVTDRSGKQVIGIADLVNFDPQHLRAEVGLVIQKAFRGQGYGEAAMEELITYAHDVIHLHQLYALVSLANENCLRLFKSIGFQENAVLKDWLYDGRQYQDVAVLQFFL
jgi:diamine N-acetyltransferase